MPIQKTLSIFSTVLILTCALTASAREVVRAPAGGGPGFSVHEPDRRPPLRPTRSLGPDSDLLMDTADSKAAVRDDEIGGDDILIVNGEFLNRESMDIAANGDIYVAVSLSGNDDSVILIHRSTDGGTTFSLWATLDDPTPDLDLRQPSLVVAEGVENRCYVAFVRAVPGGDNQVVVAWEDLDASTVDFADQVTAFSNVGDDFANPVLIADDSSFSFFYLYLVADAGTGSQRDIWFTRSMDQGAGWDAAYEIATGGANELMYIDPSISYSFDSRLHVAWSFRSSSGSFDEAVRYRRADNDADGGLADWGFIHEVTATNDGWSDRRPHIASTHDGNDVVLAFNRYNSDGDPVGPVLQVADDAGALGFSTSPEIENMLGTTVIQDLLRDPDTGTWYAALGRDASLIHTAPLASPESWSELGFFQNEFNATGGYVVAGTIATDPTRGNRVAACRGFSIPSDEFTLAFDAEWLADPGHPVQRDGFPRQMTAAPISDPGLVDLDGDGDLEIVFGDAAGNVHAIQADGSDLPGWPVNVGSLSTSPVAIGRLTLSDEQYLVAGTADGLAYALKPDGSIASGWPVDLETGAPVHVSIGALGGPFPRTVVLASGESINFWDHAGRWAQGSFGHTWFSHTVVQPCAIGDIDGDGVAEVVAVWEDFIQVFKRDESDDLFFAGFSADISGPVTLGDVNLDGDLEIAVPLADGTMHLLNLVGDEFPGWPFVSTADSPMGGAAWANMVGSDEPELAFASAAWKVHLVGGNGVEMGGFPVKPSIGWFLYTSPVIEQINPLFPDIAIGTRGSQGWGFDGAGGTIAGWPRQLGAACEQTPAVADLDQDGFNEIVMLTTDNVQVFDLRTAPFAPPFSWPMAGHDPQRTGCSDCFEDLVSPVRDPAAAAPTLVSFAAPHPNPTNRNVHFNFAVPERAVVSLEILDVRGRRIRTVERSEMPAGAHVLGWDGRDQKSQPVSNGIYFARLRVRGPGLDETMTRKVTLVR